MNAVIAAGGLGKAYRRTWALRDCTLAIPEGHVVGLVGPNGAGKTTLLRLAQHPPAAAPVHHEHPPGTPHQARADGISYQMVRAYVSRRRAAMHQPPLSPADQAVADHDLARLCDLLDTGHDIEDDNGDG
jgi:ABC-type Mn2+/Zn2+ transport system ATPase subunit